LRAPGLRPKPLKEANPEQQAAFRTGISAESGAAALLVAKGFRILARRWKIPVGEIDIVARRFVEVKARNNLDRSTAQPASRSRSPTR
jgi:putative endonuclease